jgi:hypothetical protein
VLPELMEEHVALKRVLGRSENPMGSPRPTIRCWTSGQRHRGFLYELTTQAKTTKAERGRKGK